MVRIGCMLEAPKDWDTCPAKIGALARRPWLRTRARGRLGDSSQYVTMGNQQENL